VNTVRFCEDIAKSDMRGSARAYVTGSGLPTRHGADAPRRGDSGAYATAFLSWPPGQILRRAQLVLLVTH